MSNLNDSGLGSLRQAILDASTTDHTVTFQKGLHGTIFLNSELEIGSDLTISGPGAGSIAASGNNTSRVFDIDPGTTVSISGLTITDGLASTNEQDQPTFGGGILNHGNLTLLGDIVSDNQAVGVAGVRTGDHIGGGAANFGTLTITGSTFTANQARGADGSVGPTGRAIAFPGLGIGGALWNGSGHTATVTDSRFIGNWAVGGSNCTGSSPASAKAAGSITTPS